MMPSLLLYSVDMKEEIHIGKIIEQYMKDNNISKVELSRRIPCNRVHVYEILASKGLNSQLIQRISEVLSHDFFADISEKMKDV